MYVSQPADWLSEARHEAANAQNGSNSQLLAATGFHETSLAFKARETV